MVSPLYIAKLSGFPLCPAFPMESFLQAVSLCHGELDNHADLRASAAQLVDLYLLPLNSESGISDSKCILFFSKACLYLKFRAISHCVSAAELGGFL